MVKRLIVGIVWCVLLYFGTCVLVGGVAGFIATATIEPGQDPSEVGGRAGANAVQAARPFILLAAVGIAGGGAYFGVLPGTRPKAVDVSSPSVPSAGSDPPNK